MKKICLALFLSILPLRVHAFLGDPQVVQEKSNVVHFSTTVLNATNPAFILISLSTTSDLFPHTDRGQINISGINVIVDKVAAATATVRIGVVNFVNTSTGSVTFFYTNPSNRNVSNTGGRDFLNPNSAFYRCKVKPNGTATNVNVDGLTPFILSNEVRSGSSVYRSSATVSLQLPSPAGIMAPKVGDIVMEVLTDATNPVNVIVDLFYHSEP